MLSSFASKLNDALRLLEDTNVSPMQQSSGLPNTAVTGGTADNQKADLDNKKKQEQQVDKTAQMQADQLYKAYQAAKEEADRDQNDAVSKQDVAGYNKAASSRKRMEDRYKAYQIALQKAMGQSPTAQQTNGLPQDAVV